MPFFTMGLLGGRARHYVKKLIHASIANHYDSDVSGTLHGTKHTKTSYLKI